MRPAHFRRAPADRAAADLSCIVYLVHWPGTLWFQSVTGGPVRLPAAGIAAWIATLAISWLILRCFDRPIGRLRSARVESRRTDRPVPR